MKLAVPQHLLLCQAAAKRCRCAHLGAGRGCQAWHSKWLVHARQEKGPVWQIIVFFQIEMCSAIAGTKGFLAVPRMLPLRGGVGGCMWQDFGPAQPGKSYGALRILVACALKSLSTHKVPLLARLATLARALVGTFLW